MNFVIGIVGASRLLPEDEKPATEIITGILSRYNPETAEVCSGGASGIDTLAAKVAKSLGFGVSVFLPKTQSWETGFKPRNILIAQYSNVVHSIALPLRSDGKSSCYHCSKSDKDNRHQVSGGCWTGKYHGEYTVHTLPL